MERSLSATTSFVELPGVCLAYDMAGAGTPVVFLHGGLLDRRQWDDQFAFFAQKYRVIRYDMRSAGEADTTPSSEAFSHHEDLLGLLQALKIERVSLVGVSNYAVGLDFAIACPTFVDKLVLVSPGLRGYDYRDPWVGMKFAEMMRALGEQDLATAVEVFLTMWVDGQYRTPSAVEPRVRERVRQMVTHAFRMSRLAPHCKGLEPPAAGEAQRSTRADARGVGGQRCTRYPRHWSIDQRTRARIATGLDPRRRSHVGHGEA